MPVILHIETSTDVCSAALTAEGAVLVHFEEFRPMSHAVVLSDFIKGCLDHLRKHEMKLDAVAVSLGPGSYTGLRIGLSEAKGLAYALDVEPDAMFAPMIDARRMEVYTGVYSLALEELMAPRPLILDGDSYREYLDRGPVLFFGNGSDKAREVITHPNARFISDIKPLAVDMLALADRDFRAGRFLDLAYSVPTYLKDFQATRPRKLF